jgi:predicted negative regulator of RcsB-dependent stress response
MKRAVAIAALLLGSAGAFAAGLPVARLPGFAAALANMAVPSGPASWQVIDADKLRTELVGGGRAGRQEARWDMARSFLGRAHGAEAMGVLDVMQQDDPDLALVPAFLLARGAALTLLGRPVEGLAALNAPMLADNAEACAWRLRLLGGQPGMGDGALAQVGCALPAMQARHGGARRPFVLAVASASIEQNQPQRALHWLGMLDDGDVQANLLRGQALYASGDAQNARLRLARVEQAGTEEQRIDAKLSAIEAAVAHGQTSPAMAKEVDQIRFEWRGGAIEQRALGVGYKLAGASGDLRAELSSGAPLIRYFAIGKDAGPMLAQLQAALGTAIAPDSKLSTGDAAGLFWDYRDLAPGGAAGDAMLNQLAARLQAAGLFERAGDLLAYQMNSRAQDIEKGPVSVRVASLYILAGKADRALKALRDTAAPPYPDDMRHARQRVEAVALFQLGHPDQAMAVLDTVPGSDGIKSEVAWQSRDWATLAAAKVGAAHGTLAPVDQALVLRRAVALGMLGREPELAQLRAAYAARFRGTQAAASFDMLTQPVGKLTPDVIAKAMAAIPTASPAGDLAELFAAKGALSS